MSKPTHEMNESELKRHYDSKKRVEQVSKAIQSLGDAVNVMACDDELVEGILDGFRRTHRTLQQGIGRALVGAAKRYREEVRTDARNEGMADLMDAIAKASEEIYLPTV